VKKTIKDYESVGRRFESCRAHQKFQGVVTNVAAPFSFWGKFPPSAPFLMITATIRRHNHFLAMLSLTTGRPPMGLVVVRGPVVAQGAPRADA